MTNLERYQQLKKAEIECYKARIKFLKDDINKIEKYLKESEIQVKQSMLLINILIICLITIIIIFAICECLTLG